MMLSCLKTVYSYIPKTEMSADFARQPKKSAEKACKSFLFFYWPLGGGAPRAATHYLYTIGLDNYTRSYYGRTSLKISIKEHNSSMVEGRD